MAQNTDCFGLYGILKSIALWRHADFKNSDITLEFSDITLTFWKIIVQYMIL